MKFFVSARVFRSPEVSPIRCDFSRKMVLPAIGMLAFGLAWTVPAAGAQATNFGSVNVCPSGVTAPAPCNTTLPLSFSIPAGTTIGSIHYLTLGAQNLDFKAKAADTSTTLCSAKIYTSATTCTVDVTFTPVAPGARNGAIEILDGSGKAIFVTPIYGTGLSPAIVFNSSATTALGNAFPNPEGLAGFGMDGSGNVFVGISNDTPGPLVGSVQEMLAVDGSIPINPSLRTLGGSGSFFSPTGFAIDGSGNVLVADSSQYVLNEIMAVDGVIPASPVINEFGNGAFVSEPFGIAMDGIGNVFIADTLANEVEEFVAVDGMIPSYPSIKKVGSGFNHPSGIAVDASGDVFVADTENMAIKEILAVNGSIPDSPTIKTLVSGIVNGPASLAVDVAGDVYYTGSNPGRGPSGVQEVLAVDGSIPADPTIVFLYGDFDLGLTVDGKGNVFIADVNASKVIELPRSTPPSLTFLGASVGETSSDSPQSVKIQNVGNAPLSLSGFSTSGDFELVAGSGTPADCAANTSLQPGGWCNVSVSFTPSETGNRIGSVSISDNSLNGVSQAHSIQLSGTGEGQPVAKVSATTRQFGNSPLGTASQLPLTITNVGGGDLIVTTTSINGPSYTVEQNGCGGRLKTGESCSFQVTFLAVSIGYHGDILTIHTNGTSNPTVSLKGFAVGVGPDESQKTLKFGTIPFGTTKVVPLTITYTGTTGTGFVAPFIDGPSYQVLYTPQNTCETPTSSTPLLPGKSCVLPIQFNPVSVGVHGDRLSLESFINGQYTPAGDSRVHLSGTAQ